MSDAQQEVNRFENVAFPFTAVMVAELELPLRVLRTDEPQSLWPIYHTGEHGCQRVAFFSTRRWVSNVDVINASEAIGVDGKAPNEYDEITCGSCGRRIWLDGADIEYADGV